LMSRTFVKIQIVFLDRQPFKSTELLPTSMEVVILSSTVHDFSNAKRALKLKAAT
jgi:hypothetical protein